MPRGTTSSVIEMLRDDHQKVKDLFEKFENATNSSNKQQIAATALNELDVHAKLEEGIIYPAIREEIDDEDLMNEAVEEHHIVHLLIRELKRMKPTDERFDAKFTVLGESVKHHIGEEEKEMLPKAEESDIDWDALEAKVTTRKDQLLARLHNGGRGNGRARTKRGSKS